MSEIAVMEFEIVGGAVDPFPLGTREPSEIYEKNLHMMYTQKEKYLTSY